jgi:hypothetical protein
VVQIGLAFRGLQSTNCVGNGAPVLGSLRLVALVGTDVSEERIASIIRVTRIGELGTMLAVTNNKARYEDILVPANVPSSPILITLMMEAIRSSATSVLTRATRRNVSQDILQYFHMLRF